MNRHAARARLRAWQWRGSRQPWPPFSSRCSRAARRVTGGRRRGLPGRAGATSSGGGRGDRSRRRRPGPAALAVGSRGRCRARRLRRRPRTRRPGPAARGDRRGLRPGRPRHRRRARRARPARPPTSGVDAEGAHRAWSRSTGSIPTPRWPAPRGPVDRRQPGRDRARRHLHGPAAAGGPAAQLRQRHGPGAGQGDGRRRGDRGGDDRRRPGSSARSTPGRRPRPGWTGRAWRRRPTTSRVLFRARAGRAAVRRDHRDARRSRSPATATGPGSCCRTPTRCCPATPARWAARPASPTPRGTRSSRAAERNGRRLVVSVVRAENTPVVNWRQAAALLDYGFALPPDAPARGHARGRRAAPPTAAAAARPARHRQGPRGGAPARRSATIGDARWSLVARSRVAAAAGDRRGTRAPAVARRRCSDRRPGTRPVRSAAAAEGAQAEQGGDGARRRAGRPSSRRSGRTARRPRAGSPPAPGPGPGPPSPRPAPSPPTR